MIIMTVTIHTFVTDHNYMFAEFIQKIYVFKVRIQLI